MRSYNQSGGIKQKRFQMFLKNRVWVAPWNIWGKTIPGNGCRV